LKRPGKIGLVLLSLLIISLTAGCSYFTTGSEVEVGKEVEEVKIATVDQNKIRQESETAQKLDKELKTRVKELTAQYEENQEGLSGEEQMVERQKLSQKIEEVRSQLRTDFKEQVTEVIEGLRVEEGFDIVLRKESVEYGGVDITDQVIDRLDNGKDESEDEEQQPNNSEYNES
jgi:outer membrane protein